MEEETKEEKVFVIVRFKQEPPEKFEIGQTVFIGVHQKKITDIFVNDDKHFVTLKFEDGSVMQFSNIQYTVFIPAPKPQDYAPNTSASSSLA